MTLFAFFGCESFSKFAPEKYFARGDELKFATAIYNNDSRKVRQMIADNIVNLDASGEKGFSYLMYAVYIEQYDVAKVLLENGADPNILSIVTHPDGTVEYLTPLSCVCENDWYPIKYMKLLVENGANVNDTITVPFTLCIAHSGNDPKKIRYLIEHGVKVNTEFKGKTPIQLAAMIGRWDLVSLLWDEYGADPLYVSKDGRSLAFIVQNSIEKKLGTPKSLAHAQEIMKRLEKLGVKFPVTLNPKDEKEEKADSPISQGKTDENKKE